jgi:rsbT co-antagonist protein RsbR
MESHETDLLAKWLTSLRSSLPDRLDSKADQQLAENARNFLSGLRRALKDGNFADFSTTEWRAVLSFLTNLSRQRAEDGYTPSETAMFVFSLKRPLFEQIRTEFANDLDGLAEETWRASSLIDTLGLRTTEAFLKGREELINRQQQSLLEISTPVVRLWEGVLALPLIGTLDSARTQIVMQNLLEAIVNYGATIAIIDITGVPTVDTLVAQHLLKTVAAARLMGADCIISGIRPQIAQTIIHLGVDLTDVITKATLADAFQIALRKLDYGVVDATKAVRPVAGK